MADKTFVNEDTYQTLKEFNIEQKLDKGSEKIDEDEYTKRIKPLWKNKNEDSKFKLQLDTAPYSIFVATPVHSDVSMHYTQALLMFQKMCAERRVKVNFQLMKSSLVTQGRNLCVGSFLTSDYTHLLFIDSDIHFQAESIFKMIEKDKDVISIPYPLKTLRWDKAYDYMKEGKIKNAEDIRKSLHTYPMRVAKDDGIKVKDGVIEVTHRPTGCMLIKREVFNKMIKAYPDKGIVQKTVINGEYITKPNMWNFFDTIHDPVEKTYLGEDFSFCKLWKEIGGKCHAYIMDSIVHVGEHGYDGRFFDELIPPK